MYFANFLLSTSVLLYSLIWENEPIKEDNELLEELVKNPGFDRLKYVDQSGPVAYLGNDNFVMYGIQGTMPEFSRYDHSLAVRWLIKEKTQSTTTLEIAALLHDASHTAFSHLGDHVFTALGKNEDTNNCYQDDIHLEYLDHYKFQSITQKHGIELFQLQPIQYKALKAPRGSLCADNLQYITHTAVILKLIDKNLAKNIIEDVKYDKIEGEWFFHDIQLAKLFGELSINFTKNIYSAPDNIVFYQYFTKAIIEAINCKLIDLEDFKYGVDKFILEKLQQSSNPLIKHYLTRLENINEIFDVKKYEEDADIKFNNFTVRAVDPKIKLGDTQKLIEISQINKTFSDEFNNLKDWCKNGYAIKFHQDEIDKIEQISNMLSDGYHNNIYGEIENYTDIA